MEPISAAAVAVAVMLAEGVTSEAGRALWATVSSGLTRIRERSMSDRETREALESAEAFPADEAAITRLSECLTALARRDADLQEQILAVVAKAEGDQQFTHITQIAEKISNTRIGIVRTENFRIG